MKLIELKNISKSYHLNNKYISVLSDLNVSFERGKFYAIMGHSGAGKSTLLNILGLLDTFDSGEYFFDGKNTKDLNEPIFRNKRVGLIFQDFYLDNYLNAMENVMYPMFVNNDIKTNEMKMKALAMLDKVGLNERLEHYPKELSGGEKQRVAIARALINNPDVILADEPTGNLDEENEEKIFNILKMLTKDNKCVIVVSHSNEVKNYADIVYELSKGGLKEQ